MPPPSQQRDALRRDWLEMPKPEQLKIADTFCAISAQWLDKWKAHVKFDGRLSMKPLETDGPGASSSASTSQRATDADNVSDEEKNETHDDQGEAAPPGPIDNTVILKDKAFRAKGNEPVIKAKAVEGVDFILVHRKAWALLHKW